MRSGFISVIAFMVLLSSPAAWSGGVPTAVLEEVTVIGRLDRLEEDNSVRSGPTTLVNIEAGYRFAQRWKLSAALYNVFDSDDNDIAYFHESQLATETAPVEDIHFHPVEPRTLRVTLSSTF